MISGPKGCASRRVGHRRLHASDFVPGPHHIDQSFYARAAFRVITPGAATPALLLPAGEVDTVVLGRVCGIKTQVREAFKNALMPWIAAGHKLIIQDTDTCGGTADRQPDYRFLPYPFSSSNPGAMGAGSSILLMIEANSLAHSDPRNDAFLDVNSWLSRTNGNPSNELGDSNTMTRDPHWCGSLLGTNANKVNGFIEAYTHYGRGLIVYDGFDQDQFTNAEYRQLVTRELRLPFDPDGLPCTARLGEFVVTTDPQLHDQWLVPGRTYTYPLRLISNQGYRGTLGLTLAVVPPEPTVTYTFDPQHIELSDFAGRRCR